MRTTLLLAVALVPRLVAAAPTTGTGIGDQVPEFKGSAVDVSHDKPAAQPFDSHATRHPTAYLFVGTECPSTRAYMDRIRELDKTYRAKGVDFVYVYPNRNDSSDAKTTFHKESKLGGRMIDDQGGKIASALGAQRTSEVLLVARDGTILYRGAIDDNKEDPANVKNRWVATALDEHLAGKKIATATTPVSA